MSLIGFIGTGHIAAPMVRRMVDQGHEVIVTERSEAVSAALRASHGVKVGTAQEVLDASEIVFLCLRPSLAVEALGELTFQPDQQVISVMAELAEAQLRDICAPATDITRTIPFGFVEQGGCPLPVWGDTSLISALFGPDNIILPMAQEDGLNAILSASAVMATTLDLIQTVADWTRSKIDDPAVAETYVKTLISGYLHTMPQTSGAVAQDRDALTLPGSLNRYVMEQMRLAGTHDALNTSLEDVYKRLTSK